MKTIFRKECRENFKIAVIGFAIYIFLLVGGYHSCSQTFERLRLEQMYGQAQNLQPLLADDVLKFSALFCGLFGAILGWVQIHNERHRDLWAYLVHRPISRTQIFFGKVMAGLCLYVVGAGLPLLGFVIMVAMPGHFPVPFGWKMLLPLAAIFLSGLVYYLGGLLTGVRQARWYASRGLGLGVGIIMSILITRAPAFRQVLIFLVPALFILGLAAWGSFVGNGYYEGQPKSGQRALTTALMLGFFLVLNAALLLLMSLGSQRVLRDWTDYRMAKDGTIYKSTHTQEKPTLITDLTGVPVMDKKTGRPMLQSDLDKMLPQVATLNLDYSTNPPPNYYNRGFGDSGNYFQLWHQTPDTLWYWGPNERLWGYDIGSRRFIGSLGPDGFTAGVSTGSGRFTRLESQYSYYYYPYYPARTLMTDTTVYELDYDNRTSRPFFTATNQERLGGAVDVSSTLGDWDYTLVATTNFITVLTPDGKCVSQASFAPLYPLYSSVQVNFLETNEVAFWFNPNYATNQLRQWKVPEHIEWVAADQSVFKTLDLPSQKYERKEPWIQRLPDLMTPLASYLITPLSEGGDLSDYLERIQYFWKDLLISLAASVVFTVIGWGLGRRYDFNAGAQLKWGIFNLLFGLPGLLAFICAQEWPARLPCPHCKKLRMVDRQKCEHCHADAEPPAKNGTEIFDAVGIR
jgi:ABC-type transport system involved in multi-copper enzyme maturation permease subunit